jgi:uncharacterized protein DUF4242
MNKYVIERTIPGAGKLGPKDFADVTEKSFAVLRELGPEIQWVNTFVCADKLYCVFNAKSADLVREHARRGGFPADTINQVISVVDPTGVQTR